MTSDELRAAMKALNFTVEETEARVGIYPGSVEQWLAGTKPIPERVANVLESWTKDPHILSSILAKGNSQP